MRRGSKAACLWRAARIVGRALAPTWPSDQRYSQRCGVAARTSSTERREEACARAPDARRASAPRMLTRAPCAAAHGTGPAIMLDAGRRTTRVTKMPDGLASLDAARSGRSCSPLSAHESTAYALQRTCASPAFQRGSEVHLMLKFSRSRCSGGHTARAAIAPCTTRLRTSSSQRTRRGRPPG